MSSEQPTNLQLMSSINQILDKLNSFEQRFESIDQRFVDIDHKFESIDQRFDEMEKNHFDLLDFLQEHMVTKAELGQHNHNLRDYVDRKIGDLRGDLFQMGVLKTI